LIERFERTDDKYQLVLDSVRKSDFDLFIKNKGDYPLTDSYTSVMHSTLNRSECKQLFTNFNPYKTELRWIRFGLTKNESNIPAIVYSDTFQSDEILFFEYMAMLDARRRADKETLEYLKRAYSLSSIG
jgi:hypothetical protein